MSAAGVSEEEEILGSTEEEEAEATPNAATEQGVFNPVEEIRMGATPVRLIKGSVERLEGSTTTSSTERRQEGWHTLSKSPSFLEGCQVECLETPPANSTGTPPKEEFDGGHSDIQQELGVCGVPFSTVKLKGQDAIDSNYIGVDETKKEECQNGGSLVGLSKSLDKCVNLPNPIELRSEEDAQSAPASPENMHQAPTSCVKMAPVDKEPFSPAGLIMVAEDEEAESAPASPLKVVLGQAAGSPVKVSLLALDPFSSVDVESAEHSKSALAMSLNVKNKAHPLPSGFVKLAAEKEEEEEEAEMAPGSPVNYASNISVSEEEKKVAPVISAIRMTRYVEPVQVHHVADEEAEMAPTSPIKLLADKEKGQFSPSSINMTPADKVSFSTVSPGNRMTFGRAAVAKEDEPMHLCHGPLLLPTTAVVSSTFVSPKKVAIKKEQITTDNLNFESERHDSKESACHLKLESGNSGQQVPKQGTKEVVSEDSPLVTSVSVDGQQVLSGALTSVTSKGIGESLRTVVHETRAWCAQTLPETDTNDEQEEDCAQEYPGSPMDLDDDESTVTSENLLLGVSSSVFPAGQGLQATSDITSTLQQSSAKEVCNGTDPGTGTSAYTSYLDHGATLCPGIETDDGTFPYSVEFEKHWKATQENPFDFTLWTDLLEYVEQENNVVASRKAYNAFFTRYPYCYGYWKKYADMERRFGYLKEAEQVFEQGAQSIPLSVELWIHFITFLQETADMTQMESIQRISNVFEMALAAAGMEFRSDKLWEMYADWANAQGDLQAITVIYDRVLSTPTQLYSHHFEKFKEHVTSNSPVDILSKEEYMWLKSKLVPEATPAAVNMGSGDQVQGQEGSEEAAQVAEIDHQSEVDPQKMRELIISLREQLYKQNEAEVSKRWVFEEAIKRPYFHVKPLERAQLINWRDYLDFEISSGTHSRTIVLFERCVIACALYEEFWVKYTKYLESHTVIGTRSVFQRSCLYHLPRKPNLHLLWAAFEEKQGDVQEARNILKRLEEAVPGLAMVRLRRVSLERRVGNLEEAEALLRDAILFNEGTPLATFYSIKLARLVLKVQNNLNKAREVLQEALAKDPENAKLYLNLLEMEFSADVNHNERNTIHCIERVLSSSLPADTKVVFSQRRMEFLEDFGSSIKSLLTAYDEHQKLLKLHAPKRKVTENGSAEEPEDKKAKAEEATAQPVITAATSTNLMGGDVSTSQVTASAAYNYNTWYQNYGAYNYQNTWNYNYYPQS